MYNPRWLEVQVKEMTDLTYIKKIHCDTLFLSFPSMTNLRDMKPYSVAKYQISKYKIIMKLHLLPNKSYKQPSYLAGSLSKL
jgi:hypothetical protein